MAYNIYWLLTASLLVLLLSAPSVKSKSKLPRLGKDLGLLNLRTWLARIYFLMNGRDLVEKSYLKVCYPYHRSRQRLLT